MSKVARCTHATGAHTDVRPRRSPNAEVDKILRAMAVEQRLPKPQPYFVNVSIGTPTWTDVGVCCCCAPVACVQRVSWLILSAQASIY
jgi:hypothetical protein